MFQGNTSFNQPIGNWNVSSVVNLSSMFAYSIFNQPIGNWNVANVEYMSGMFYDSQFNQPIGNWNVKKVGRFEGMFEKNTKFNQDLSKWCAPKYSSKPNSFDTGCVAWTLPKPNWGAPC